MKSSTFLTMFLFLTACSSAKPINIKINPQSLCFNCNVIVFTSSSLRADRLSMYGYKRATDKALSRWMKNGVIFENHYAVSRWPYQALMTISTGLAPEHHKVLLNSFHNKLNFKKLKLDHDKLSTDIMTLPQILKENEYTTAFWGGDPHPAFYAGEVGYNRGIDYFTSRGLQYHEDLTDLYKTMDQLKDKKFFLNVNTVRSHFPHFVLPKNFTGPFSDPHYKGILPSNEETYYQNFHNCFEDKNIKCPIDFSKISKDKMKSAEFSGDLYKLLYYSIREGNADDNRRMDDYYDDSIAYTDVFIDGIFNYLEKNKLLQNTLILFTSDVGSHINEKVAIDSNPSNKVFFGYTSFMDEVTKIPLIAYIPEREKNNSGLMKIENYTNTTDILPTILGLSGSGTTSKFDGLDLSKVISGDVEFTRDYSYGLSFRPQKGVETFIRNKNFIVYTDKNGAYGVDVKKNVIISEKKFPDYLEFTPMLEKLKSHFGPNPVDKAEEIKLKFNENYVPFKY